MNKKPVLVFACGNPSRGDDAVGPEFIRLLDTMREDGRLSDNFETITDFQLQVEHTLDLEHRELVLFADASVSAGTPFEFRPVFASKDTSFSTHAISPAALMAAYDDVSSLPAPAAFMLGIKAYEFELGEPISDRAHHNLTNACEFTQQLLMHASAESWLNQAYKVAGRAAIA